MNRAVAFSIRRFSSVPPQAFLPVSDIRSRVLETLQSIPSSSKAATENSHLVADLGFDSLLRKEFVMKLEAEFCVSIPATKATSILSIPDAIQFFSQHPKAR
mmetsp:Transcript_7451/g.7673  ORF Transcript_7451/g.7673 Transcript_7451/m.7673 type:complete len:102 (-) Transcript_7451:210-515(-)